MEAINRAVEDAADFMEMKRKLLEKHEQRIQAFEQRGRHEMLDDLQKMEIAPKPDNRKLPKQPGENRQQYRARIHGKVTP